MTCAGAVAFVKVAGADVISDARLRDATTTRIGWETMSA
jgi:hypothetical protein